MKILALDPAVKCGFAHSCGISGTIDLSVRSDESKGFRFIRLRAKLDEIKTAGIDFVVFEAARAGGANRLGALVVSAGFQAIIQTWCIDNKLDYRGYSPSEIKKHATGNGNANKELMLAAAQRKWPGVAFADDNEVDARWILDLAHCTLDPDRRAASVAKRLEAAAGAATVPPAGRRFKRCP